MNVKDLGNFRSPKYYIYDVIIELHSMILYNYDLNISPCTDKSIN